VYTYITWVLAMSVLDAKLYGVCGCTTGWRRDEIRGRALAVATAVVAVCAAVGVYGRAPQARSTPFNLVTKCGSERWAVKTLTDAAAPKVRFGSVKATSVKRLRLLNAPTVLKATTARGSGTERNVYSVTALLLSMRKEDDSDIHLVVADPKLGGTMIVEFPSSTCTTGGATAERRSMRNARADLTAACGGEPGTSPVTLTGKATITGVGYFDPIHGQTGVAPNGIELHPVLAFASTNCKRVPTTPPPG
jgi:hypothetical protein